MSNIRISDCGEQLEISFADLRKYHGRAALMALAVGFRVQQAAFRVLYGEAIPERSELRIFSGHAGPGFRDAFECVTRAVTRGAYQVDTAYPRGQYDPYRPMSYAYVISRGDQDAVEVVMKDNFLPQAFYDYMDKGRRVGLSAAEHEAFEDLKRALCEQALQMKEEDLLEVKRIP